MSTSKGYKWLTNGINTIYVKENEINIVEDLWVINRHKLKDMNFKDNEINQIIIKLQLIGIDLNHKKY